MRLPLPSSRVDDTCGAGLSQPTDISGLIGCNHVRATRAFLIIGLVWASMAFLMAWIGYHAWDDIMYRGLVIMLSLFSCQNPPFPASVES